MPRLNKLGPALLGFRTTTTRNQIQRPDVDVCGRAYVAVQPMTVAQPKRFATACGKPDGTWVCINAATFDGPTAAYRLRPEPPSDVARLLWVPIWRNGWT